MTKMEAADRVKLFLRAFKWLLLFLATLTIGRAVEAIAVKVTGDTQFFRDPNDIDDRIAITFQVFNLNLPLAEADISYVVGGFQLLVIVMLLFRYFVNLVEPVTEVCRTDNQDLCFARLGNAWSWRLFLMVPIVSAGEFMLIVHAALAIPHAYQWLIFLALLALFDITMFILLLPLFSLAIFCCLLPLFLVLLLFHALRSGVTAAHDTIRVIFGHSANYNRSRDYVFVKWLKEKMHNSWKAGWEWVQLYIVWDVLDLSVAGVGLWLIRCQQQSEFTTVFTVFVATFVVSIANLWFRKRTYNEHLSLLNNT